MYEVDLLAHSDYMSKSLFQESFLTCYPAFKVDFPLDVYSTYDLSFNVWTVNSQEEVKCLVELKQRRFESTKHRCTLLEKSKYDRLIELADKMQKEEGIKCIPFYCAQFDDCYYMFNLRRVKFNIGKVNCRKTTDFEDDRIKTKEMIFIDLKEGKRYEYKGK